MTMVMMMMMMMMLCQGLAAGRDGASSERPCLVGVAVARLRQRMMDVTIREVEGRQRRLGGRCERGRRRRMGSIRPLEWRRLPLVLLLLDAVAANAASHCQRPVTTSLWGRCRSLCPTGPTADGDGLRRLSVQLRGGARQENKVKNTPAAPATHHHHHQQQQRLQTGKQRSLSLFAATTTALPAKTRTLGHQGRASTKSPSNSGSQPSRRNAKMALLVAVSVAGLVGLRSLLGPYLSPQQLQERTLNLLQRLQPDDTSASSTARALLVYAGFMALVELLGLSTIPVETAAAMVFGYRALPASALGKLTGAVTAYGLGRTVLRSWANDRLKDIAVFQLLQQQEQSSVTAVPRRSKDPFAVLRTPLATAFLMKYSCFPEFVKNFGSSLLEPVTPARFVLATMIHGWSFTLLWTMFGVDSARRLQAAAVPRNWTLLVSLTLSFVIGLIVSPALMTWWIHDLRKRASSPSSRSYRVRR